MENGRFAAEAWYRARQGAWCVLTGVSFLLAPTPAPAQSMSYGVRAGAVISTALAEDRVANPALASAVGGVLGPVRAVPAPGFQVELTAALPMRPRTLLELAVGWTATRLDATDDGGTRDLQDIDVGHATVSVRYMATSNVGAACGFGLVRYFADGALFASGTEPSPLVECASRFSHATASGRRFFVRVAGQAHWFRTPVLVDAGAQSGSVFRVAVQVGLEMGGPR